MKAITVKKGNNHAHIWRFVPMVNPTYLAYTVIFTESCRYHDPLNTQLTEQRNKLFGFTIGLDRHKNSIRFAWNYNNSLKRITLYAYYYINGKRQEVQLSHVMINRPIVLAIIRLGGCYHFVIGNKTVLKVELPKSWIGFRMNPFFGGKAPAPHDITIRMERIYLAKKHFPLTESMVIDIINALKPSIQ